MCGCVASASQHYLCMYVLRASVKQRPQSSARCSNCACQEPQEPKEPAGCCSCFGSSSSSKRKGGNGQWRNGLTLRLADPTEGRVHHVLLPHRKGEPLRFMDSGVSVCCVCFLVCVSHIVNTHTCVVMRCKRLVCFTHCAPVFSSLYKMFTSSSTQHTNKPYALS